MKITKLIHKHKKNCDAVRLYKEGTWSTPWYLKETYLYHYKNVGRLICNSADCKGEVRVDLHEIEEKFNDW